jgi:glycosyltransferase involved in cell wall biosynthesis
MKVEIFIPCFNEEKNIPMLVFSWSKAVESAKGYEVLVTFIDNGSNDLTNTELNKSVDNSKNKGLKIITKEKNDGYGSGIMFGLIKSNSDLVGWAHADLQFNPLKVIENLNELVENLSNQDEILIIGERLNRAWIDATFTKGMSFFVWLFTRINIQDINSQPKIFSNGLLTKLNKTPNDFNLDLHICLKAKKLNYRIVRIKLDFKDRIYESAKGGGTFYGKIKLSFSVLRYLFNKKSYD